MPTVILFCHDSHMHILAGLSSAAAKPLVVVDVSLDAERRNEDIEQFSPSSPHITALPTFASYPLLSALLSNAPPLCERRREKNLVSDLDQVIPQLLHRVGRNTRLHRLRVMCDENRLRRLDNHDALSSLFPRK